MEMFANLRTWNTARKTRNELNKLSDRELYDIGIHRNNISSVARGIAGRTH